MDDRRADRLERGAARDELLVALVPPQLHFGQRNARAPDLLGRRHGGGRAGDHLVAVLVDTTAVEDDDVLLRPLLLRGHRDRDGLADRDRLAEAQVLAEVDGPGAGKPGAENGRDQGTTPHAVADDVV